MLDVMEIDIDRPEKIVYVVGLGPGEPFYMTQQAANTLESVDAICGYKVYLDLIRDEFPCEEYYATGMTQELDRCRWALEKARTGKRVALVCSGDAGVYGMASPLLELAPDYPDVAVEIVPGLTAALSGGAVLGAPLAHDFCVISLSDRLTPWEVIEKRLLAPLWEISALRCTIPPPRAGRTIWQRRCASCWKTAKVPIPSAASCATSAGRVRPPES